MKKLIALLIVVMSIGIITGCDNSSGKKDSLEKKLTKEEKEEKIQMAMASDPIALQLQRARDQAENRMDNLKGKDGREDDLQEARKEWLSATNRYYARCQKIRDKYK